MLAGFIYPVFGHWVWQGIDQGVPGGWLAQKGFVDFAGSTAVHSLGGWCSLATILVLGPRVGRFSTKRQFEDMASTDLPIGFLGAMLLWFGWFGFNGGSNLVFDANVANILSNTLMGGVAGVCTPVIALICLGRVINIKPMMNGALAGLVAITAGCHAYSTWGALLVGAIGSLVMLWSGDLLERYYLDDVVGAIPVHLAAGIWGTLAVGLCGDLTRLGTGLSRWGQLQAQISGVIACGLWSFAATLVCVLLLKKLSLLRVSPRHEYIGLNISEHGAVNAVESVYSIMKYHAQTGDLRRRVKADTFTEVGRIGEWYNQVIMALETAVTTNEAIINTALDGIVTLDQTNLMIQSVNPATLTIFGHEEGALLQQPIDKILVGKDGFSTKQLMAIAQSNKAVPMVGVHANGHHLPLEVMATLATAGKQPFFTMFFKDISVRQQAENELLASRAQEQAKSLALERALAQLKKTQAQLIQQERLAGQGQLVAGIAHEINNPMTFIHGNLEHAQQYVEELLAALEAYQDHSVGLPNEARMQLDETLEALDVDYIKTDYVKLFESMQVGTKRIRAIVKELRTFSRHDEASLKSVDVHTGLDSCLRLIARRLEATSKRGTITILKRYGQLPPVECYASELNRAFLHILTNAIDAFDNSGRQANVGPLSEPTIILQTRQLKTNIQISISNNGPHIPTDVLKKIFDPFFTTHPVGQATGLGCTISHQIVVGQHHGKLYCHSKEGGLTFFVIELPLT